MPPDRNASAPAVPDRASQLDRLQCETFDVAMIGGGINGAAIARDAAMRGLRVALLDAGDFAGATSSRSSKLIHGGLRYLPQGHLRLVYQALRERERLRHVTAPHLVHKIEFLFPFYRGQSPGRLAVSTGLFLYDVFARMPREERHHGLRPAAVATLEPALKPDGLAGGATYIDGWGDDARITLENALDAAFHGAAIANYVRVEGFSRTGSQIVALAARDLESGAQFELRARTFVNAAGPWADDIRRMERPDCAPSVRLTKGVHIVIEKSRLPVRNPLVLADNAGRIIFVMPHGARVLIGTTDTDFDGARGRVAADPADIAYLLETVNGLIPAYCLRAEDVTWSFAGLRALAISGGTGRPSAVSRDETILESPAGLLTVAGGKLTTHREIAGKVIGMIMKKLGRPAGSCPTLATPLPGARPLPDVHGGLECLPPNVREQLVARYGTRAAIVAEIAAANPDLACPLAPDSPAISAEVIHAVRNELARSVTDFLARRTAMVWRAPRAAVASATAVARLMAVEMGWDGTRERAECAAFMDFVAISPMNPLKSTPAAAVEPMTCQSVKSGGSNFD
jgi:glycerol-3-phosphate dehydrogenase